MLDVTPLENMEEDHIFLFLVLKDEFNKYFFQDFLIFFFQRVGNLEKKI